MSTSPQARLLGTDGAPAVLAEAALLHIRALPTFAQFSAPGSIYEVVRGGAEYTSAMQYAQYVQDRVQLALNFLNASLEASDMLQKASGQ